MKLRAVLLAMALAAPASAEAREAWFALIAGFNRPLLRHEKPLRFADNDALKYYEFFRSFTGDVRVFAELDEDTRGYPAAVRDAVRTPRKEDLLAAFRAINDRIAAARNRDPRLRTRFFFVFSGHGGEDEIGGYLNILGDDGQRVVKLTKLELWRDILARSRAHENHVIIDACSSGSFVTAKSNEGKRKTFSRAWRAFLRKVQRQKLEMAQAFERTTFFVSSDAQRKSHEFGDFQGGVFTHELLSALKGAADVDGDGRISYAELQAFLAAANARAQRGGVYGVRLEARIVVPKAARRGTFLEVGRSGGKFLEVPRDVQGRFFLVDDKNLRYADFHKTAEYALRILLVPRTRYFLYQETAAGRRELALDMAAVSAGRAVAAMDRTSRLVGFGERGPVEEAFAHLFDQPLSVAAVHAASAQTFLSPAAYLREHFEVLNELDGTRRRWRYFFYGLAGAAGATAVGLGAHALTRHLRIDEPGVSQVEIADLARSRERSLIGMGVSLGVAAGALLTAVLGFGEEADAEAPSRRGPQVRVSLGAGSAGLELRY
jgi:uncharacterized caspase-like protein